MQPAWIFSDLRQLLSLIPREPERYYSLALIHLTLGEMDGYLANLNRSLQANPNFLPAVSRLADAYMKSRQYEKAIPHLQCLLEHNPDDVLSAVWLFKACCCLDEAKMPIDGKSILQTLSPPLLAIIKKAFSGEV